MAILETTRFVESELKTVLNLKVRLCQHLEIEGAFTVPSAGFLGGYIESFVEYAVNGIISDSGQEGGYVICGIYEHVCGECLVDSFGEKGMFEMSWDGYRLSGWWSGENGEHHPWSWSPTTGVWGSISNFVQSKGMTRFSVFWCWMFFLMTSLQMVDILEPVVNCLMNTVYSLVYLAFYTAYFFTRRMPAKAYSAAIGVYTLGYSTFAGYFLQTMGFNYFGGDVRATYMVGASFFTCGSIMLTLATIPRHGTSCSPWRHEASLFWGSLGFLAGCMFFITDASIVATGGDYNYFTLRVGYGFFVIGRLYFLWGTTTQDVNIWLRTPRTRVRAESAIRARRQSMAAAVPFVPYSDCGEPFHSFRNVTGSLHQSMEPPSRQSRQIDMVPLKSATW